MDRWKRFIDWCQRPSMIKTRSFNPRNFVVLVTFIIFASSITFGAWRYQVATIPPTTFINPEDIETLTITSDFILTEDYFGQIVIAADGVTVDGDGHMIIGPGHDVYISDPNMEELNSTMTRGILLEGRTGVTVKNCRVTGFGYGIFLNGSIGNTIQGNKANDNINGFVLERSDGNSLEANMANNNQDGFYLFESDGNRLKANTANNNTAMGFMLYETDGNSFEANMANDNAHFGFFSSYTSNDTFLDNIANGNFYGFDFVESFRNIIQGNTANDNINGFVLERSDRNLIEANTANNNTHSGVHLGLSSNNTLTSNTISSNNEYGICFGESLSPNNRIYHNNFVNNIKQVNIGNIENSANAWDEGYPSGGNYWSDYRGVDANGDGIGDTPYVIDTQVGITRASDIDRFPLMAPINVSDYGA